MKFLVTFILLVAACGDSPKAPIADLEKPSTCMECHPTHYTQWSGSMHAYASDDPIFVAMQNRGQREAQLGTFCVQCHAPMAVALHPDADFTNFDPTQLPEAERGITCYFCHNVAEVDADHNNGLKIALDQTMHGGLQDPGASDSPAHNSVEDSLIRGGSTKNKGTLCGSCHDVTTPDPHDVKIERTFAEWQASVFAPGQALEETCSTCHMVSGPGIVASGPGLTVNNRPTGFHDHTLAAIDQPITPFYDMAEQATDLDTILEGAIAIVGPKSTGGLCLVPLGGGQITVRLDNLQVGHMYPSGAAQDRRVWVEVIAYDASNTVLFSSGVVGDTQDPEDINDPNLDCGDATPQTCLGFWDRIFKDDGTPAHFFWEVASEKSHLLRPAVTNITTDPTYDHSTMQTYTLPPGVYPQIDHMTARVRTRPFNYAALNDLVSTGDLDPQYAAHITTLDPTSGKITWTKATEVVDTGCNP